MEYYYAPKHPEYQSLPRFKSGCLKEGEQLMQFIYPKKSETILLPKSFEEQTNPVVFKLAHRNPDTKVYWYIDKKFIEATQTFHEITYQPEPGEHLLTVTDQQGNSLSIKIEIEKDLN